MAGAALRGFGAVLKKVGKKPRPISKKYERMLKKKVGPSGGIRTQTIAEKYRKALGPTPKAVKKKPIISKADTTEGIVGAGMGAVIGYTLGKKIEKKEAKAKETKEKLKEATEKHKKKTKEKREKHGKPHA